MHHGLVDNNKRFLLWRIRKFRCWTMDCGWLLRRYDEANFDDFDSCTGRDLCADGSFTIQREHASAAAILYICECGRSLHEHRHESSDGVHVQLLQPGMAVGRESELWRTGIVSDGAYNLLWSVACISGRMA